MSTLAATRAEGGYNHDVLLSKEFLTSHEAIRGALNQPTIRKKFADYDASTTRAKRRFVFTGMTALSLAIIAICGVITEVALPALGRHLSPLLIVWIECTALASLAVSLAARICRLRHRYLNACFARERYRQLFFQIFLDGELVQRLVKEDPAAQGEVNKVIEEFEEEYKNPSGARSEYVKTVPRPRSLMFKSTSYSDEGVAEEVLDVLYLKRIKHQAQYIERRLEETPDDRIMSLKEHFHQSEAVATFCLLGALAIPVAQLLLLMRHGEGSSASKTTHIVLSTVAILLVAVSAAVRAYQCGMTVPEEIESYDEYGVHIEAIKEQFSEPHATVNSKLLALRELELESERELRRFLAMKGRARFII